MLTWPPVSLCELLELAAPEAAHGVRDLIKHTLAGETSPASLKEWLDKPGAVRLSWIIAKWVCS